MKYTLQVNQIAAFAIGIEDIIDLIDLCLFDAFKSFANSSKCEKMIDDGGIWFWIAYAEIIKELPLSGIKTKDGIYRRMLKLQAAKLIVFHPNNQKLAKTFFKWGDNYDAMERKDYNFKPTDEKPKVHADLRTKDRRGADETPKAPTDEKPNNQYTFNQTTKTKKEPLAENEFPQPIEGGLRVTVIQGHSEVLQPVAKKKKKAAPGAGDGVIQEMVTAFETEHRQHFKDAGGEWIGFTWQAKEFPALNSIRAELEKRYRQKLNAEPTPENIVESWAMFLRKAAKCDKFILENLFTPSKIWGQFQSIIQKIHTNNGIPPSTTSNGRPDQNERNRIAAEKMVQDVLDGRV